MTHFRKKNYLCSVINNNKNRGQRYIHCNRIMKTNKLNLSEAVSIAIEEVNNNVNENMDDFMKKSLIYLVAEYRFDGLPYKWVEGGFRPMELRKPHSENFYEKISDEYYNIINK